MLIGRIGVDLGGSLPIETALKITARHEFTGGANSVDTFGEAR